MFTQASGAAPEGILAYDTVNDLLKVCDGTAWQNAAAGGSAAADSLDFTEFKDAMTLDASTDIAVTGTDVLSIINTGTGNSFVVNDVASDTTPFVVDASGNVGIGTSSPSRKLDVVGSAMISGAAYVGGATIGSGVGSALSTQGTWNLLGTNSENDAVDKTTRIGLMHYNIAEEPVTLLYGYSNTSANSVHIGGSTSAGNAASYIAFWTAVNTTTLGGSERMRIDSNGNVGIGTTSPTNLLSLGGNAARTIWMERHTTANTAGNSLTLQAGGTKSGNTDQNGGDLVLSSGTATGTGSSNITFKTHPAGTTGTADTTAATAMTIVGSGNVAIGTSSTAPAATLTVVGTATFGSSPTVGGGGSIMRLYSNSNYNMQQNYYAGNDTTGPIVALNKYRAAGQELQAGDRLGQIDFMGVASGGNHARSAQILAQVDGASSGSTDMPGRLSFWTTPDASATVIERMRIDNSGNVGIGTTSPMVRLHVDGGGLAVNGDPAAIVSGVASLKVFAGANSSAQNAAAFVYSSSNNVGVTLNLDKSRGTPASPATVSDGDVLGTIRFRPFDGTNLLNTVNIGAVANGVIAAGSVPTDLIFSTGSSAAVPSERLRISSGGNVGIGTTSPARTLHVEGGDGIYSNPSSTNMWTSNGWKRALQVAKDASILFSHTGTTHAIGQSGNTLYFSYSTANDSSAGANYRMVIDGSGSVGIGQASPQSLLSVGSGGYAQFEKTSAGAPIGTDCDAANEAGRVIFDTTNNYWYVCEGLSGWTNASGTGSSVGADTLHFTEFKDAMVLDASTDIAASGTDVLSITNTGTGNSFVVNDVASDTTPFVIDAAGRVAIGTTSTTATFQVGSTAGRNWRMLNSLDEYWAAESNPRWSLASTGGSPHSALTFSSGVSTAAASGTAVGQLTARTLAFYTSNATALVERMRIDGNGNVGIGATPSYLLSLGGDAARTIGMERHSTANTAGNNLTVLAGGATSGATDKNGGDLILSSGTATGTGTSKISFQTHPAGSTGTTDTTAGTAMTILGNGNVGIGTSTPGQPLEVAFTNAASTAATIMRLRNLDATHAQTMDISFGGTALSGANGKQITVQGGSQFSLWQFNDSSGNNAIELATNANTTTGHGLLIRGYLAQTADLLNVTSSAGSALFNVTGGGNVGIGMLAPTAVLNLPNASGSAYGLRYGVGNGGGYYYDIYPQSALSGGVQNALVINANGDTDYRTALSTNNGSGRIVFMTGQGTSIGGTNASTEKMRIEPSGNVGIGQASPQSLLSVGSGGYAQFEKTSAGAPTGTDCDAANEAGRVIFDTTNNYWYVCEGAGGWTNASGGSVGADTLDFTEFKDAMALDASTDIAASGTNVLSITNIGTGNSFVVNDAASDTTPFVIDASGNVGIGTTAPGRLLNSALDTATTNAATFPLLLTSSSTGTATTSFGTGIEFEVENNAGTNKLGASVAAIQTTATAGSENFALVFKNMNAGATAAETMRITSTGQLSIGNTTANNAARLGTYYDATETSGGVNGNYFYFGATPASSATTDYTGNYFMTRPTISSNTTGSTSIAGLYNFAYPIIGASPAAPAILTGLGNTVNTNTTPQGTVYGINNQVTASGSNGVVTGYSGATTLSGTSTSGGTGVSNTIYNGYTGGTIGSVIGANNITVPQAGSTTTTAMGAQNQINNYASVGTGYGAYNYIYNLNVATASMTNAYGTHSRVVNNHASATITTGYGENAYLSNLGLMTTYYGLSTTSSNTGAIGTYYGLYLGATTGAGTITTEDSIYSADTANSYFAGNIGIGQTSPQSLLTVGNTGYAQFEKTSAGAPTGTDCDAENEVGRVIFDTTNNYWYVCEGLSGWTNASGTGGSISADTLDFTEFKDAMALDADTTIAGGDAMDLTITSDLTAASRSTDLVAISQANHATNNSTGRLLHVLNNDAASTADVARIYTAGSSGNVLTLQGGSTALNLAAVPMTGKTISFGGVHNLTSGMLMDIGVGNGVTGTLTAFTGDLIKTTYTRTHSGATTITDTGNYLELARVNTNSGSGTFNVSGDLVNLTSSMTQSAGTATDSSRILYAAQNYASASGNVVEVVNNGTGNSFLVNDVASDTTPFVVDASGKVGIGAATPTADLTFGAAATVLGGGDLTLSVPNQNSDEIIFAATGAGSLQFIRGSRIHADASSAGLVLTNVTAGTPVEMVTQSKASGSGAIPDLKLIGGNHVTAANAAGSIRIQAGVNSAGAADNGNITLASGSTNVLTVQGSSGNVGIGTTNPSTALDVAGGLTVRGMTAPAVSAAGQGRIYFDSTSNTYKVSENGGAYTNLVGASAITTQFAPQSAAPAACAAGNDGTIALTAKYTLCVCRNGNGWVRTDDGASSCVWAPVVATGGTITTSGGYKIHTFTSSGTFQITSGTDTVEYLVVGGGGGGGGNAGSGYSAPGGGGAGGMKTGSFSRGVGSYTVTVGNSGTGGAAGGNFGGDGGSSVFDTITSSGGGGGGYYNNAGRAGGSGGGAGGAGPTTGGTGTGGQGNNGGGVTTNTGGGPGGGGAGAVGTSLGASSTGGAGGGGTASSITGASVTYAGGGGGGSYSGGGAAGGTGGGGTGGAAGSAGGAATANTGGGGGAGGGNGSTSGGAGGSGIVIVRYAY